MAGISSTVVCFRLCHGQHLHHGHHQFIIIGKVLIIVMANIFMETQGLVLHMLLWVTRQKQCLGADEAFNTSVSGFYMCTYQVFSSYCPFWGRLWRPFIVFLNKEVSICTDVQASRVFGTSLATHTHT